jgi:acyl-CoA thioester hydrolase
MTDGDPQRWPDLAGRMDGATHLLPARVYFEDTDFSGLAYHGSYVRWCERGRSDWLRLLGIHHNELFAGGPGGESAAFVVRRLEIDYFKPARIDDALEVATTCVELTTARITLDQQVRRGNAILARARVLIVLVSDAGRLLRLPQTLKDHFAVGVAAGRR